MVLGSIGIAAVVALPVTATGQGTSTVPPAKGPGVNRAAVEIVEFSDFQCPYCALAVPILNALVERHPDEVRLVFRHYPLPMHEHAERAARAAVEAQRQGAFWPYHDLLFRHGDRLTDADLIGYADSLGLDARGFQRALETDAHAAVVESDVALGRRLGIRGTPTFFVGGYRLVGPPPPWVFEEAIRAFKEGRVEPRPLVP